MYYCLSLAFFLLSYFSNVKNSDFLWRLDDYLADSRSRGYTSTPSIGFVLAHPDDESMFFMPTLNVIKTLADSRNRLKPQLHFLYLSNGDYYNDGRVRENELDQLCKKHKYSCSVVHDSDLKDGPARWKPEAALKYIRNFVSENDISVLFTFDDRGVSGHPNHVGTHYAVKLASKSFQGLLVFYLQSFNLLCKYSSFLSVFQLLFRRHSVVSFSPLGVFENMRVHRSQLRFHIPFWSLFSSYSYINTYYTDQSLKYT